MFRFEHPDHLYALLVLPVMALFFAAALARRKRLLRRLGEMRLIERLAPEASRYKDSFKFLLLLFALALFIIGWANPQWGARTETVERQSVDVFIALDISQSMLAQDVPPDRMERAKRFARALVETLRGERVGLMLFAGNAYLQVPLTTDYAALDLFLKTANPSLAPTQGTAIDQAIELAMQSFPPENVRHKALIIISDGETHEGDAIAAARAARGGGLQLFCVGVGTAEGAFIPVYSADGVDYKRDAGGGPVRSFLDEKQLINLARAGGGAFFNLSGRQEAILDALRQHIDTIEKRAYEQRVFTDFQSYFQYFIGLGLFLIVLEFIIPYRKSRRFSGRELFDV
jgi:Ca-activated chloride channel family protein